MGEWVRVGTLDDFREGRGTVVRLGETKVAVFNIGGRLRAIQDSCPHMGASLGDSPVRDGKVLCHMHGWSFDLETGQGSFETKRWLCARVYEVELEDREVFLRRPEPPADRPAEEEWPKWDPKFLKKPEGRD